MDGWMDEERNAGRYWEGVRGSAMKDEEIDLRSDKGEEGA